MRMSWSLDGSTLAAPHAINNGFPTAKLIDRTNWGSAFDLVGHRKHVVCTRYCPNLFHKAVNGETQDLACLALGSKDRSVSVWTTADRRALVVIHDLFTNSVSDLTWSSNGMELMACSLDGTVSYMQFSPEELGTPWSTKDLAQLHHKSYGQSLLDGLVSDQFTVPCRLMPGDTDQADIILETPEALALQQTQADVCQRLLDVATNSCVQNQRPVSQGPSKQIEIRGKDGRRRIIPKFLGHLDSMDEDVSSNPQFQPSPSSQQEKSLTSSDLSGQNKPLPKSPEQLSNVVDLTKSTSVTPVSQSPEKCPTRTLDTTASPPFVTSVVKSLTLVSKDNRPTDLGAQTKRPLTDMDGDNATVNSPGDDEPSKVKSGPVGKQKKRRRVRLFDENDEGNTADKKVSINNKSGSGCQTDNGSAVQRLKSTGGGDSAFATPNLSGLAEERKIDTYSSLNQSVLIPEQLNGDAKTQFICSHPTEGPILVELCGRAATSGAAASVSRQPDGQQDGTNAFRVVAYRNDRVLWEVSADQKITSYAHADHIICFGDTSGRVQLIHINGSRICSPLMLSSAPHRLMLGPLGLDRHPGAPESMDGNQINSAVTNCNGPRSVFDYTTSQESLNTRPSGSVSCVTHYRLTVLCQLGRLLIWDIPFPSSSCFSQSMLFAPPVLPKLVVESHVGDVIRGCPSSALGFSSLVFTSDGYPVVHRRDGSSFVYHTECRSWFELFDASNRLRCLAAQKASPHCPSGPLASYQLLSNIQGAISNTRTDQLKTDNLSAEQRFVVQRFLEDQAHNANLFGSSTEFRHWFTQWFRHLIENNLEDRIRTICQDLIGPVFNTSRTSWKPMIKGISKHELLKNLLPLFALNLRLQRLYVETKTTLEQAESYSNSDS